MTGLCSTALPSDLLRRAQRRSDLGGGGGGGCWGVTHPIKSRGRGLSFSRGGPQMLELRNVLRLLHMMNVRFSLLDMAQRILGVTLPNF
jgi:hypothetical protein